MYVILQSYNETNKERQEELNFVMRKLLVNKYVKKVVDLSELNEIPEMYESFKLNEKYEFVGGNPWLTYNYVIKYARENVPKGEVVCLLNSDVFIGSTDRWSQVYNYLRDFITAHKKPVMLTLTRHEWSGGEATSSLDPQFIHTMGSNSQDVWIWLNGTIGPNVSYEIPLGIMGCDNAIAHRLLSNGGVIPYNLGLDLRVFHYDQCRSKTAQNATKFHKDGKKQSSQGFENEGALTVPFLKHVPVIIQTMPHLVRYRQSLLKIDNFSKMYELFLRIHMNLIRIRN